MWGRYWEVWGDLGEVWGAEEVLHHLVLGCRGRV